MKDTDLPPLTDEMARLLRAEARRPARPAAEGDAILARVARSLTGGGAGGSGNGEPHPPDLPAPGAAGGSGALQALTRGLPRSLAIAAVSFLLGGGAGGSVVAYLHRSPPRDAPPPAPAPTLAAAAPAITMGATPPNPRSGLITSSEGTPPREPPARATEAITMGRDLTLQPIDAGPVVAAPRAAPKPTDAADGSARSTLAEERALLEGAREALKRGDTDAALDRLSLHARRYADGQLVEEREALRVRALAAGPRAGEARGAARAFRERFPNSVFSPDLDPGIDGGR